MAIENLQSLQLDQIAKIIARNWTETAKNGIYFGAKPYLQAMSRMSNIDEVYGMDSARSIVNYFLANASTWRGPIAKEIKAELNRRLKK